MLLRLLGMAPIWLAGSLVLGISGLIVVGIGVGTGIDFLFASSHPIGVIEAFLLRAEYTVAGTFLLGGSVAIVRIGSNTDGERPGATLHE